MAAAKRFTITISPKGQLILPDDIRQGRKWVAGTELLVEETPQGVLLKSTSTFAKTRPEDVFGMLPYKGRPKTLDEMDAGVFAEAKRRHAHN